MFKKGFVSTYQWVGVLSAVLAFLSAGIAFFMVEKKKWNGEETIKRNHVYGSCWLYGHDADRSNPGDGGTKGYEAVLRERIAHRKGELIQPYGDGSLSIFDSASSAVQCAQEIQEQIRESVPLRIGIHLGEGTRDGEHTFGDGVNIASRIESMGIAGAVLLSCSVRQQIKNKPEFELVSVCRH